ncbi:uncharacterized protein M6B38_191005 [Iris pallida]|uniref:Cardiolipin synthase N-terminal domain-containing protein n=1 Tax=Iris pallida TaxID=29817 RepID=A0AAX6EET3_IRIPA|nr:uncharacterized protein M6B38_191005 [Iris pallida]
MGGEGTASFQIPPLSSLQSIMLLLLLVSHKYAPPVSCCSLPSPPRTPSLNPKALKLRNKSLSSGTLALRTHSKRLRLQLCRDSSDRDGEGPIIEEAKASSLEKEKEKGDWTTSVLLFALWAALMFYVFRLAPDQTPIRDMYFLQKLLNLKGDDGFRMNEVLVALWYIMGLWPLVYSMLLLPSGRSSRSKVPVWPFLILSFFGGAYVLIPYFVLWKPPPPAVGEDEISKWPLNFLESKITAAVSLAAGLGLIIYAVRATGDDWSEFYQYFRESKFIHLTCIDFSLLSAFAPFWVYNDMTARKWFDKGSWLLFAALVPYLGPSLYVLLRPSLSALPMVPSAEVENE